MRYRLRTINPLPEALTRPSQGSKPAQIKGMAVLRSESSTERLFPPAIGRRKNRTIVVGELIQGIDLNLRIFSTRAEFTAATGHRDVPCKPRIELEPDGQLRGTCRTAEPLTRDALVLADGDQQRVAINSADSNHDRVISRR